MTCLYCFFRLIGNGLIGIDLFGIDLIGIDLIGIDLIGIEMIRRIVARPAWCSQKQYLPAGQVS